MNDALPAAVPPRGIGEPVAGDHIGGAGLSAAGPLKVLKGVSARIWAHQVVAWDGS
ncbi:MAG: hypothetical protein QME92_02530 [Bacillota bacterium]|nr:hypothetical protein [Bacillota bacterium]